MLHLYLAEDGTTKQCPQRLKIEAQPELDIITLDHPIDFDKIILI